MTPIILYEDNDFLAVNKPSGMIVNRADTTRYEETLQEWVEKYLHLTPDTLKHERDDFINRGGIVHRLDKETSGVILLAKNSESFYNLQSQFKNRTVAKTYTALVHGKVIPEKGEITAPIGRLPWNRMRFGVVADGREADTVYEVKENFTLKNNRHQILSLLSVFPKTGRTHQIRVHMKHINHPVYADYLYAGRKNSRDDRKYLQRLFLHATTIIFHHPTTGEEMTLTAPLPNDLQNFIDEHCERIEKQS